MQPTDWIGFPGSRAMGSEELEALARVLERRTLYRGAGLEKPVEVEACEREIAQLLGRRYVLLMNSGTSALQAALEAWNLQPGDEVILPGYGWLTDLSTLLYKGLKPVFAPIGPDLNLLPEALKSCLSPKTRLLAPVHACGTPYDVEALQQFSREEGIPLLEDACQCLGGTDHQGRPVPSQGTVSVLSFQAFKIITCGEGGALITDDSEIYEKAVRFHDAGLLRFAAFSRETPGALPQGLGLNLRLSELSAALLRVQLKRLPELLEKQRSMRAKLGKLVQEIFPASLLRVLEAPGNNGTFLTLAAKSHDIAAQVTQQLSEQGYPTRHAIQAPYHALPGWLRFLQAESREFRVVQEQVSRESLGRAVLVEVNHSLSPEELEAFQLSLKTIHSRIQA